MNLIAEYVAQLASICARSADPAARDRCCGHLQEVFDLLHTAVADGGVSDEVIHLGTTDTPDGHKLRKIIQSPNYRYSVMCHDPADALSGLDFVLYTDDHRVAQRYRISPALGR